MSLNSLKGFVHLSVCFSPVQMVRRMFDESAVVIEHPKIALEVFDRFWGAQLADGDDSFLEGGDAGSVDAISEEVER